MARFYLSQSDFCPHNSWPIGAWLWSLRAAQSQMNNMNEFEWIWERTEETVKKKTKGSERKTNNPTSGRTAAETWCECAPHRRSVSCHCVVCARHKLCAADAAFHTTSSKGATETVPCSAGRDSGYPVQRGLVSGFQLVADAFTANRKRESLTVPVMFSRNIHAEALDNFFFIHRFLSI